MVAWRLLGKSPRTKLTVDLVSQRVIAGEESHAFEVGPFFPEMLLKGVDELGLTLSLKDEIGAFERVYAAEAPWAVR